ncbi:28355_t:CDS:2, partial [Racocetra persica]
NTDENTPEPDNLTTTNPSQDNTITTDPIFSQDNTALAINLDNNEQSAIVPKDNISSLLKNCLRSSVRKSNNIKNISEHSVQDS